MHSDGRGGGAGFFKLRRAIQSVFEDVVDRAIRARPRPQCARAGRLDTLATEVLGQANVRPPVTFVWIWRYSEGGRIRIPARYGHAQAREGIPAIEQSPNCELLLFNVVPFPPSSVNQRQQSPIGAGADQ